jgi:hypothetical protein
MKLNEKRGILNKIGFINQLEFYDLFVYEYDELLF